MALPLYASVVLFPGGAPAANWPVDIWLRASNQRALLFTSAAGTTTASNPLTTDFHGVAEFYAAPGDYIAVLAGELSHIQVAESETQPVIPGLHVHTQSTPAQVWEVAHHFGVQPLVNVLVSGETVEAAVSHPDEENTLITFGTPTAGVAHLRR